MQLTDNLCNDFFAFLAASPTPFHATENLVKLLAAKKFKRISEDSRWDLQPGGRHYFTRSDSTLVAFIVGNDRDAGRGIRVVGAHTDSPCLKVKPKPEKQCKGYQQLGIEVYGGALLGPWFDRDLSIAGKVSYSNQKGELKSRLINFQDPIAVIPSLAIHLDREVNNQRSINPQTQMNPILLQSATEFSLIQALADKLAADGVDDVAEVLNFDLSFYDVQPPALVGMQQDFIAGARLDNLLSSYVGVRALAKADTAVTSIMICNDHEEVGSRTDIGAQGPSLEDLLVRLFPDAEERQIATRASLMLSVDNAHGVHPNFVNKHDDNHGPILNAGPVLKFDANQSYATSSTSAAFVQLLAKAGEDIPLQTFVTRADMRCGSTIGPLTAANIGIRTLDIGVPTFAMHSVRELGGKQDLYHLEALLQRFYAASDVRLA